MDEFDDYNDYFDDEKVTDAEATSFERVGPSGKLAELISGVSTLYDMKKKTGREKISQEDRFLIFTDAIARRINDDNIATISEEDINTLLTQAKIIKNVEHKNPVAYILGFLATKGGRTLDKKNVMHVINNVLPEMKGDGGVEPPDVIRYARFWYKK
jgi:hypothetical protein